MADPRFFNAVGPFKLHILAERISAKVLDSCSKDFIVSDVAPLHLAEENHLSFLDNPKYITAFSNTHAGACIVHPLHVNKAPKGTALLVSENPYKSYALAAQEFYPVVKPKPGISPSALIESDVLLGKGCRIEPGAIICSGAKIGDGCHIDHNAVIRNDVIIGRDCFIGACASLSHCLIGDRVRIFAGAKIGQDGFGFAPSPDGHIKVPQLGRAIIGDDCEIGANTCIDRGSGPDTVIGQGTWLDNLVQIGHNVKLGRGCVMAGQSGVSGSTEVGDFVFIGGQAGLAGHVKVGSGSKVAAQSGVMRDIPPGTTFGGTPAVNIRDWHRQTSTLAQLIKGGK